MTTERFTRYYKETDTFKYSNPNPASRTKRTMVWDRGDCAIRSLAHAAGCAWIDAFDFLTRHARAEFNVPNDIGGFRRWLVAGGAVWIGCKAEKGKPRMTLREFAEAHQTGRYAVEIASHLTACVDGKILDTWNCGEKCVVGYFDMTDFHLYK